MSIVNERKQSYKKICAFEATQCEITHKTLKDWMKYSDFMTYLLPTPNLTHGASLPHFLSSLFRFTT